MNPSDEEGAVIGARDRQEAHGWPPAAGRSATR